MSDATSFCGIPRTSEEWAALAKFASGHIEVTKDELRRLFMLGLVDRELDRVCLSQHGLAILGLPDRSPSPDATPAQSADHRSLSS